MYKDKIIAAALALVQYSVDDNDGKLECLMPKREHVLTLYAAIKAYDEWRATLNSTPINGGG